METLKLKTFKGHYHRCKYSQNSLFLAQIPQIEIGGPAFPHVLLNQEEAQLIGEEGDTLSLSSDSHEEEIGELDGPGFDKDEELSGEDTFIEDIRDGSIHLGHTSVDTEELQEPHDNAQDSIRRRYLGLAKIAMENHFSETTLESILRWYNNDVLDIEGSKSAKFPSTARTFWMKFDSLFNCNEKYLDAKRVKILSGLRGIDDVEFCFNDPRQKISILLENRSITIESELLLRYDFEKASKNVHDEINTGYFWKNAELFVQTKFQDPEIHLLPLIFSFDGTKVSQKNPKSQFICNWGSIHTIAELLFPPVLALDSFQISTLWMLREKAQHKLTALLQGNVF